MESICPLVDRTPVIRDPAIPSSNGPKPASSSLHRLLPLVSPPEGRLSPRDDQEMALVGLWMEFGFVDWVSRCVHLISLAV